MLNRTWLSTFKTLVEVGHFTQTAEKLFMTQPGVSQHVSKLEQACGHPLLTRYQKRFDLTEQGRLMYQYACQIEQQESDLAEAMQLDSPHIGECKLACSGAIALYLYPKLLDLQSRHPQLQLPVEAAPNTSILSGVHEGRLDFGIVTTIDHPELYTIAPLGDEELCLILPKSLAMSGLSFDDLNRVGLIAHPDAERYLNLYFSQCGESELEQLNADAFYRSGYMNQIHQILLPVSKGLGFTILAQAAIESSEFREDLVVYQPSKPVKLPLSLVHKAQRQLPARKRLVRDYIIEQFVSE
ncbi:LysR family transcriptional regulator [Vibrio astriarenae]|uniref:LysR family transcriptional regulator n=1 Tax=Vibrio astriarenae TaxID=1481923 RepID=A0A7Z2YFY6_9VIBR|nr:LysR family transcriptional regulator [Vibrio astriarenae]QIA65943.1 LysR family transcriptional regulator [Vibrio astriarenae]